MANRTELQGILFGEQPPATPQGDLRDILFGEPKQPPATPQGDLRDILFGEQPPSLNEVLFDKPAAPRYQPQPRVQEKPLPEGFLANLPAAVKDLSIGAREVVGGGTLRMAHGIADGLTRFGTPLYPILGETGRKKWRDATAKFFAPVHEQTAETLERRYREALEQGGLPAALSQGVGDMALGLLPHLMVMYLLGTGPGAGTRGLAAKAGAGKSLAAWKSMASKESLIHAGKIAAKTYATTPGDEAEATKAAAISFLLQATPAFTARTGGAAAVKIKDVVANLGVDIATNPKLRDDLGKLRRGKMSLGELITENIGTLGTDVAYGLMTSSVEAQYKPVAEQREQFFKAFEGLPKEVPDAQGIREDARQVPEARVEPGVRPEEGRADLERVAPAEPGRPEEGRAQEAAVERPIADAERLPADAEARPPTEPAAGLERPEPIIVKPQEEAPPVEPYEVKRKTPQAREAEVARKVFTQGKRVGRWEQRIKNVAKLEQLRAKHKADKHVMQALGRFRQSKLRAQHTMDRMRMRQEFRQTSKSVDTVKETARKYVQQHLPLEERGRLITDIQRVKTKRGLFRVMAHADKVLDKYERGAAINEYKKVRKGLDLKHMRPEYQRAIREITDMLDQQKMSQVKRQSLGKRLRFLTNNPDFEDMPKNQRDEVLRLFKKPLSQMKAEDIRGVTATVKLLAGLEKKKNNYIQHGKARVKKQIREESLARIATSPTRITKQPTEFGTQELRDVNVLKRIYTGDMSTLQTKVEALDGGQRDGPAAQILDIPFRQAQDAADAFSTQFEAVLSEGAGVARADGTWSKAGSFMGRKAKAHTMRLAKGRKFTMTKDDMLDFFLNTECPDNYREMFRMPLAMKSNPTVTIKMTPEDIATVVAQIPADVKDMAAHIRYAIDEIASPAINKVSLSHDNFEKAVVPQYWPRDKLLFKPAPKDSFTQATIGTQSMFKERRGGGKAFLIGDAFAKLEKIEKGTAAFVGFYEPVENAKDFIANPDWKNAVIKARGKHFYNMLEKQVQAIDQASRYTGTPETKKIMNQLYSNAVREILGANPGVMAIQPLSYLNAERELGLDAWAKGLKPLSRTAKEKMMSYPTMAIRAKGRVNREMGDKQAAGWFRNVILRETSPLDIPMKGITRADMLAIRRVWGGSMAWVDKEQPGLRGDSYWDAVYQKAQDVIIRTQPTYQPQYRSPIGLEEGLQMRLLTAFMTQRNKNLNMLMRDTESFLANKRNLAEVKKTGTEQQVASAKTEAHRSYMQFAGTVGVVLAGGAMSMAARDGLRDLALGRKNKWVKKDEYGRERFNDAYLYGKLISHAAGSLGYFVQDGVDLILSGVSRDFYYRDGNILAGGADELRKAGQGIEQWMKYADSYWAKDAGKAEKGILKAAKHAAYAAGKVAGVPVRNIDTYATAAWKHLEYADEEKD